MTALAADRKTLRKYVERIVCESALVAATTSIYNGALVATNAAGDLVPASDTAGLTVQGRARKPMINATGAALAPTHFDSVEAGVFCWNTTGGSAITKADIGKNAYVLDDNTVVRTGGTVNAIIAGTVDSVDSDGVWVKTNC